MINLTEQQLEQINRPEPGRVFLEGPAGTGKTTVGTAYLERLLQNGIPAETILVLVPQRTLALPYYRLIQQPDLPPGGIVSVATLGGLAQRSISLFWPLIAAAAGFGRPDHPATFLTLETAQYYLARVVTPLLEKGYFETVALDRNRLLSQILDNLNKAAGVGFPYTAISEKLKAGWIGKPDQLHVYDEAQECANQFRRYCLENNLLDFSLQLEVFSNYLWPSLLCRQYLTHSYRHLIYDNIEEDVPVAHDIIREWLPELDTALIIYDSDAGYRSFLGADPTSAYSLRESCDETVNFEHSWITSPDLSDLQISLTDRILRRNSSEVSLNIRSSIEFFHERYYPQMVTAVCQQIDSLVREENVLPGEIVVLAPFLSDSLRFSLMNRLEQAGIPVWSHRPSRSLREEPAAQCLLTLARLAHPAWELGCTLSEVRYAFMQTIAGLDLVRADLLARIVYNPKNMDKGLNSFDLIRPEMQERITYALGERYEALRNWLKGYQAGDPLELDIFLSRLFGEVLSQPDYGFYQDFDRAAVTARLIESIQKFRWVTTDRFDREKRALGKEYIQMVSEGVIAAQYLLDWNEQPENAVLLAPAYTYLMTNRPVSHQFWLDAGSQGWSERLLQPLTHPYILSRNWPAQTTWTDVQETYYNQVNLARLTSGLIRRCREHIYFYTAEINEQGDEQRGPLLQALQSMLRKMPDLQAGVDHV
ncbi:MAG: DEAD/DEAH box helicase family protein [Anaerolineaceae bacterium]|nr:DEAD/DEAH box helicase family protein [Anaerolineaceae bacterium]